MPTQMRAGSKHSLSSGPRRGRRRIINMRWMLAACFAVAPVTHGQPAAAPQRFEVASVKPAEPDGRIGKSITGASVQFSSYSLRSLIGWAYETDYAQIEGPAWIDEQRFNVSARMPDGAAKPDLYPMLRQLLNDRFGLVARRESRKRDVMALVVAKDGPKMMRAGSGGPDAPENPRMNTMTMRGLATSIQQILGTVGGKRITVVDRTGLSGEFQFVLNLPYEEILKMAPAGRAGAQALVGRAEGAQDRMAEPSDSEASPAVFDECLKPLGLKLERRTAPIEYIIVDHVEKTPTEK